MTTILALDSSSENCSIALYHQQCMSLNSQYAPRKHTQLILPLLKQELTNKKLVLADLDAIAFGAGPGSFTGIRIAAGVAQGLAFGLDIPIYAISNLKALALQSYLEHKVALVLACIDARMGEVYWGLFEVSEDSAKRYHIKMIVDEQVSAPDQVVIADQVSNEAVVGIGSGVSLLSDSIIELLKAKNVDAQPNADTIAYLAETDIFLGVAGELKEALPSYVRDTVTWNKLPGRE
tara:strand:+ start:263 stop:967 length:705 start_codon:yes stop_codon:yes gene_type:complete